VDEEDGAEPLRRVEEIIDCAEEDDVHCDGHRVTAEPRGVLARPRRPWRDDEVEPDPGREHEVGPAVDLCAECVAEAEDRGVDEQGPAVACGRLVLPTAGGRAPSV
jgi:hypothetical protein